MSINLNLVAMNKSVVLLSGGLDSTYNFVRANDEGSVALALTFDYGQRAAKKEIQASKALCEEFQVPHQVITLDFFTNFKASSLNNFEKAIPMGLEVDIESLEQSQQSAKSVWVPNRNGIFLNIGAGFAESLGAQWIVPGFNKEEAATFPDNSIDFSKALDHSFSFSTSNSVIVKCFSIDKSKIEIVEELKSINFSFSKVWPCYLAEEEICGSCESCQRFLRALKKNGISLL